MSLDRPSIFLDEAFYETVIVAESTSTYVPHYVSLALAN